jgi:hypothetical protein
MRKDWTSLFTEIALLIGIGAVNMWCIGVSRRGEWIVPFGGTIIDMPLRFLLAEVVLSILIWRRITRVVGAKCWRIRFLVVSVIIVVMLISINIHTLVEMMEAV